MVKPAIAVAKGLFPPLRIRIARDCFHEGLSGMILLPAGIVAREDIGQGAELDKEQD